MASLDLVFHGVNANVGDAHILKDVYGAVLPGQIMAVMGPSGAGKTTLMSALSGRVPLKSGTITLNNTRLNKDLSRKICYVLQDDVFFPSLTLKETLILAAMIRLPDDITKDRKLQKLDNLIDDLDLRRCLDTPMGGPFMPGLSGGERKRASIVCELITDPTVILLDEPTSGLDYRTAFHLMKTLKHYAVEHQKTVVMTIHQPASQIFLQFDLLLLMCDGHSVYYGAPSEVTQFFAEAGHPMAPHYNPADFILEKLKESIPAKESIIRESYKTRQVNRSHTSSENNLANDMNTQDDRQTAWNKLPWKQVEQARNSNPEVNSHKVEPCMTESLINVDRDEVRSWVTGSKWPTGFLTQYRCLAARAMSLAVRRLVDKSKIFESVFMCAVLSLVWFQLPRSEDTLRDRMGLVRSNNKSDVICKNLPYGGTNKIFYISMTWGFTPMFESVTTYPQEQGVVYKERTAGWYRLSAYVLARLTSELPIIFIQPALVLTVVYFVTGLNSVVAFLATLGTLFLHAITGQSIGLCVAIFTRDLRRGISSSTVIIMFTMLLGGFYTRNLPFWLDWAKYLSFLFYTYNCLMILEFTNSPDYQCAELSTSSQSSFQSCLVPNTSHPTIPSQEVLLHHGIDKPFWQYFLPLFAFLFTARLVGYLLLRYFKKPK